VLREPLAAIGELREAAPFYFEWLRHGPGDSWWDWAELPGKYGRTQAADGATRNFAGLVEARRAAPREARTALVVGPWVHGVEETGETVVGDRDFGPGARIDYDETVLRWMDRYVRGIDNGVDREKPVRVFVMGANRWLEADAWPIPGARETPLFLGARGTLSATKPAAGTSSFVSDPARPVVDPHDGAYGARDYRALAGRKDLLTFETAPLGEDLTVVGPVTAEIYLSTDASDLDLWVRIYDVAPDGTAWNLMSPGVDVVRASYRSGTARRELLRPGRVYPVTLTGLVTANTFRRGHRVRIQISGAFAPHLSRNLQTGALEMASTASRAAKITVRHDRKFASRIVLPVLDER
jgi:putative CocE/NonD family hydrolase